MERRLQELEQRHETELADLRNRAKVALKAAKKSEKAQVEASYIQMEFDLKAQHREEIEELEEKNGDSAVIEEAASTEQVDEISKEIEEKAKLEESINSKKAKAKKKQEKRQNKEKEKEATKDTIRTALSGQSQRDIELKSINEQLQIESLKIKDIASDGNCLYRAIADQLFLLNDNHTSVVKSVFSTPTHDFRQLRKIASMYIRDHAEEFAPFLGIDLDDTKGKNDFQTYCMKVESDTLAEWGGQLEIRAICEALCVPIHIYAANTPILRMGEENTSKHPPLRLAYHRHYYTLGEHYNSIVPIDDSCDCGKH